jgi:pyruvate/2-oxoglutarate/acetoin dehydrogenase E1 component
MMIKESYGTAIRSAFEYLLDNYPEFFIIGQGLWSPWYVGNTMTDLDKKYGEHRVIDTPVSESAVTGLAVGASLCGSMPVVVHPRIDFMLYAMDPIVNQAAKWAHMTGGSSHPGLTVRCIINRGGEQGAQHSQSLHSWFTHIPGLRVVMPYSVEDARDLLIASVLCKDPVIFIDDNWLYKEEAELKPITEMKLTSIEPKVICKGSDITIVGSSYATKLAVETANELKLSYGFSSDVIDLRVLSPLSNKNIINSVLKTKNLVVIDGGTKTSGYAAEIITSVVENIPANTLNSKPLRLTLPDSPAPTSKVLENAYYPNISDMVNKIISNIG